MKVRIIEEATYALVARFMTLHREKAKVIEIINRYQSLNYCNFRIEFQYKETIREENLITFDDIQELPVIAPEQAYKYLEAIKRECMKYASEVDPSTFQDIIDELAYIERQFGINSKIYFKCATI